MIVCFRCSRETKLQLDQMVATGHYHDHSEAIATAIRNLSVIHSELGDARSIVIDHGTVAPASDSNASSRQNSLTIERSSAVYAAPTIESPLSARQPVSKGGIPALFQRRAEISKPARFADSKSERPLTSKSVPINQWVFGQFNRLLPAKVTCRALANMMADGSDQRPLERVAMDIANEAAKFGDYLSVLDEKRKVGRDDAMAVAFPKGMAPTEFKSIQRFANQFVGSVSKEGQISGLPIALKLIGGNPSYSDGVALTEAGWQFGTMPNPILDGSSASRAEKFSDDEITFLLDHILTSVPFEAFAYWTILDNVMHGAFTPNELDSALSKLSTAQKKMERSFVSTQRSGAICRMTDLGLIARNRSGTRVSYVVLPRGKEFLGLIKMRLGAPKRA